MVHRMMQQQTLQVSIIYMRVGQVNLRLLYVVLCLVCLYAENVTVGHFNYDSLNELHLEVVSVYDVHIKLCTKLHNRNITLVLELVYGIVSHANF